MEGIPTSTSMSSLASPNSSNKNNTSCSKSNIQDTPKYSSPISLLTDRNIGELSKNDDDDSVESSPSECLLIHHGETPIGNHSNDCMSDPVQPNLLTDALEVLLQNSSKSLRYTSNAETQLCEEAV